MHLTVDLHSHSAYAGGVGHVSLPDLTQTMKIKGIDVYGVGDCLHPKRLADISHELCETSEGLFSYAEAPGQFLLQTEIVITLTLPGYDHQIVAHHLLYFPDFESIGRAQILLERAGMKNTIGRPYLKCSSQRELEDILFALHDIHPYLEIIPAHVMTPLGVLGSKNGLSSIREFYGDFTPHIRIAEMGLSADPTLLGRIPDLAGLTLIANSDTHSASLNRIGREFTILEVASRDYKSILNAMRGNEVVLTAKFHPGEGRYYLTGHRADQRGHQAGVWFDGDEPDTMICPECGRKLVLGVKQRCLQLADPSLEPRDRACIHILPLIEVIALAGKRTLSSKMVQAEYQTIIEAFGTEIGFWQCDFDMIQDILDKRIEPLTLKTIQAIKEEHFHFDPPGYDGSYGVLKIDYH